MIHKLLAFKAKQVVIPSTKLNQSNQMRCLPRSGARILVSLLWVLLLASTQLLAQDSTSQIDSIRLWHSPDKTRVVFDVSENIKHKFFGLKNPERLVVDIKNAGLKASLPTLQADNPHLNGVRSGSPDEGVLRFVFELKVPLQAHSFVLTPNELYGHRLVLDLIDPQFELTLNDVEATLDQTDSIQTNTAQELMVTRDTPPDATLNADETVNSNTNQNSSNATLSDTEAASGNSENELGNSEAAQSNEDAAQAEDESTSDVVFEASQTPQKIVVAIDAGHGGEDPGALGHRGSREKKITLSIAKHLSKIINADSRMQALLIREGDYYIDLTRRRGLAKEKGADIFISIHADAFTKKSANGLSVFALSQRGATSAMARALAKKENASDSIGGVSLANKDPVVQKVLVDLTMTNTIRESVNLGGRVLKELGKVGRLHSKRVEQASFVVLKSPDIPSILVETGFITNLSEEKKLRTSKYQKKIAKAIHTALGEYYEQTPYYNQATYSSPRIASSSAKPRRSSPVKKHKVRRGDTLSEIALKYGTTVTELKRLNKLRGNTAVLGQTLKLPSSVKETQRTGSSAATPGVHIVKRGDSLSKISARYNVTISALKRLNGLSKDSVYKGQKIKIPGGAKISQVASKHKVKRGDTLSEIAEKYGVTIKAIMRENGLSNRTVLLGQTLKIPR